MRTARNPKPKTRNPTRFEFCFGSAVSVNDNSTLRASSCAFLDSFSALACLDGTLRDGDDDRTVSYLT